MRKRYRYTRMHLALYVSIFVTLIIFTFWMGTLLGRSTRIPITLEEAEKMRKDYMIHQIQSAGVSDYQEKDRMMRNINSTATSSVSAEEKESMVNSIKSY